MTVDPDTLTRFVNPDDDVLIAFCATMLSLLHTDGTMGLPPESTGETLTASPDSMPVTRTAFLLAGTALTLLESTIVVLAVPVTVALELAPFATVVQTTLAVPTEIVPARVRTPNVTKPVLLKNQLPLATALVTDDPPPCGLTVSAFHVVPSTEYSKLTVPVHVPVSWMFAPAALFMEHRKDCDPVSVPTCGMPGAGPGGCANAGVAARSASKARMIRLMVLSVGRSTVRAR